MRLLLAATRMSTLTVLRHTMIVHFAILPQVAETPISQKVFLLQFVRVLYDFCYRYFFIAFLNCYLKKRKTDNILFPNNYKMSSPYELSKELQLKQKVGIQCLILPDIMNKSTAGTILAKKHALKNAQAAEGIMNIPGQKKGVSFKRKLDF